MRSDTYTVKLHHADNSAVEIHPCYSEHFAHAIWFARVQLRGSQFDFAEIHCADGNAWRLERITKTTGSEAPL
jgi:hypothetical protein